MGLASVKSDWAASGFFGIGGHDSLSMHEQSITTSPQNEHTFCSSPPTLGTLVTLVRYFEPLTISLGIFPSLVSRLVIFGKALRGS